MFNRSFIPFRKNGKRTVLIFFALLTIMILPGCGSASGTINEDTPGIFNHYVIYPLSELISWLAGIFQDNYGFAIMAITLIIRLALFPLMQKQYKSQRSMRQKMAAAQPELKKLEEKFKGKKDADSLAKKQQEQMALYQKHEINPLAIGCLPMLIQIPILTGLYSAIKMTPEMSTHAFLWFKLGQPDLWLPLIAAFVYFLQFKVSQRGMDTSGPQQQQLAFLGYLSPIMMGLFALWAPAAISLYWVTGGLFMIGQSFLLMKLYPKTEAVSEKGKQESVLTTAGK
ncbi:membrane protein insertase YidC [Paenibacillus sp. GCM10027627]|uniref:membrane protein insertase YidC n=1 Tax=unclassified Paenibacillus TaxID=185978 RepID=UPI0036379D0B